MWRTVNPKAKGYRTVAKCRKFYEGDGWKIANVEKTSRFIQEKDLFGLFDLIGIRKNEVIFIQVKTNRKPKLTEYEEFAKKYCGDAIKCELYIWFDRKGPVVYKFTKTETIKEDYRNA